MICKNCKKEIDNDSKFCEFCRAKVGNVNLLKIKIREALFNKKAIYLWLFFIATILLINALFEGSERKGSFSGDNEDFYTFLRLYIFCVSLYLILKKWSEKNINFIFPFIITGIIFNPFAPFRFDNDFLDTIKFFAAIFFGYLSYKEYKRLKDEQI